MKRYVAYYIDGLGKRQLQWQCAENKAHCCTLLAEKGIVPIGVYGSPLPALPMSKIPQRALAMFFSQLSMALASGVPLMDAMHYMEKEQSNERLRQLIQRLQQHVMSGVAFSESLRRESGIAPMLSGWIAIGEKQGRLAQVLADISVHLENQEKMKKQIQQQLLYPMIVLVAILIVGAILSLVVMPVLARQFMGFEAQVSGVMRFFLVLHDFLAAYGLWILLFGVLGFGAWYWNGQRQHGPHAMKGLARRVILTVPVLKKFFVLRVYVPFARFLGQMMRSGVPVDDAIQSLKTYFADSVFAKDVDAIAKVLTHGGSLALAISDTVFVPDLARQMLLNGERYGRLPEALLNSADYYESTLFEELHLMIRFVEPFAVALLGILVLFMALGLFMPVMESYQMLLTQ